MQAIRAMYDGKKIEPLEPIKNRKKTEIIVIFPDIEDKGIGRLTSKRARSLLRGSAKGEHLTAKLLKTRKEDKALEKR